MQAIVKGQESSAAAPLLQLFTRIGGNMADIVSGTYTIDKLPTAYGSAPSNVVGSTAIVPASHKLSTGSYAVLTGDTTSWDAGSYQIVAQLVMEASAATVTHVIPFELLDSNVFPNTAGTGAAWRGYARTHQLLREGYVAAGTDVGRIQLAVQRISRQIEEWTKGRIFEQRYMTIRLNGQQARTMLVPQSIIAVALIQAVALDASGVQQTYSYDQSAYSVFNRHMDGLLSPDDRFNPKISLTNAYTEPTLIDTWPWPNGQQNVEITGLFGYVDPDEEAAPSRYSIGHQPEEIEHVCGVLVARHILDPTMSGGPSVHNPGLVKKYSTRHQSIEFFGAAGSVSFAGGMSGDPLIDAILTQYVMPATPVYAEREAYYDWPND